MNKKHLLIAFLIGLTATLSAAPGLGGLTKGIDEAKEKASEEADKVTEKVEDAESKAEDATTIEGIEKTEE